MQLHNNALATFSVASVFSCDRALWNSDEQSFEVRYMDTGNTVVLWPGIRF